MCFFLTRLHSIPLYRATDADSPKYGVIRYGFATGDDQNNDDGRSLTSSSSGAFTIDSETGDVTATRTFDAESSAAFEMVVRAWNPGREDKGSQVRRPKESSSATGSEYSVLCFKAKRMMPIKPRRRRFHN